MKFTAEDFEAAVGRSIESFHHNCHAASISLIRSGVLGEARVARGTCPGVGGQHSWVVVGKNCYYSLATVIDPTLWSYDPEVEGVWCSKARARPHIPFGAGSIFNYGMPRSTGKKEIKLDVELSSEAAGFLEILGPLDRQGWSRLAHAPIGGWPSAEIIAAMFDDERLSALVPIDIVGMITDRNPGGLYLADRAVA